MAHKGRHYPIKQQWRIYATEAASLAGYPPETVRIRAQTWNTSYSQPPVATWIDCNPSDWTPGDLVIEYRSSPFSVTGHVLEVGTQGAVQSNGGMLWKYCCWDNDVDQIPWGWLDQQNHWPFFPGDARIITIPAPSGATFSPRGTVELEGKGWP